jgi:hypothetical protein
MRMISQLWFAIVDHPAVDRILSAADKPLGRPARRLRVGDRRGQPPATSSGRGYDHAPM